MERIAGGFGRGFGLEFQLHIGDLLDGFGVALGDVERGGARVERAFELLFGIELGFRAQACAPW